MKRAFTLIELLVVISIMAIMGTVAVGGYRAMQRGMDERGTMENVNAFVSAAYQRAQIDRLPTVVFFWNETVKGESGSNNTLRVVGKAVAVRRGGRISKVEGSYLLDEFSDLNFSYTTSSSSGNDADGKKSSATDTMYLYPMDDLDSLTSDSRVKRSHVRNKVFKQTIRLMYLSGAGGSLPSDADCNPPDGDPDSDEYGSYGDNIKGSGDGNLETYAFQVSDAGGVDWKTGMAYGFEFAQIQLPVGFIFGNSYSQTTSDPIKNAGTIVFRPGLNQGSGSSSGGTVGRSTVVVYALRPGSSGMLEAKKVDTSKDPSK